MPLEEQILDVVFQTGIDEQHDDRHVQPGALLSAINVRYDKELGIKHRPGNTILSASSDGVGMPASSRAMLATHKDELLFVDGTNLHSYVPAKSEYSKRGGMPLPSLSQQVITSGVKSSFNGDVAASDRYAVYVWDDGGGPGTPNTFVYYSARDLVSGAEVSGGVLDTNNHFHPRVCHVGNSQFVVTMTGGDNGTGKADIVAYSLQGPVASGAWTFPFSAATIANDNKLVLGIGAVHALTAGATGQYIIAYQASATSAITFRVFTGTTNTTTGTQAEANNLFAIRLSYTQNENLWCAYRVVTTGVRVCARLASNVATSVLASTTVAGTASLNARSQIGVTRLNATTCAFAFTQPTTGFTGTGGQTVFACKMTMAGVLTANSATYWARLQSDVIVNPLDGKVYAWLVVGPPGGQLSSVFADLRVEGLSASPGTSWAIPHANASMRIANDAAIQTTTIGAVSSLVSLGAGKYLTMVSELRALVANDTIDFFLNGAAGRYNYSSALVDMAYFDAWLWAEAGQSTVFAGGTPTTYDGRRPVECGFLYAPDGFTLTNGGAGTIPAGTYGYVLTYRYIDAQGQIHESAPTSTNTITLAGASNVVVAMPTYGTSRMWGTETPAERAVGVNIYRSTATATSGPYYLVTSDNTAPAVSPQTEAASFTDTLTDAQIIKQPQLYTGRIGTQTAILSNVAPPALSSMVEHKGRLFGIDPTGKNIWFTKSTVTGEATGSKWCDEFTIAYTGAGVLTSLASLDDKLVAFTRDRVYVLYGDGPTDGLLNNDFTGLQRVTSDIGGVAPKGMVLTEEGLYFRSSVGIYIMTRGLEIKWIGRVVQDTVDAYPNTNYAVVHPSGSQVFFGLSDGVGTRLMFDDNVRAWGRDAIDDSASNENAQFASSVRLNGKLYLVDTLGTTYVEDTTGTVFTDNGLYVPMTVEMAWVKGGSIQGFQRVWRAGVLGRSISPHDLKISIGTDYSPSYAQTHTFPWATLNGLTLEAVKVRVVRALCESVRVKLETLTPSSGVIGTGESASFAGVTFELGVNKHMKPQAASGAA